MKNKLLFSAAALVVAFSASGLSARSLNTFDESDRVAIGAYSDRVNAVVQSLGLSSAATSKSTPLKAEAAATVDATLILNALGNANVAKFVAKELGLAAETSAVELYTALTDKFSDKEFAASAFARNFADVIATSAVKVETLRTALDAKVTALATAKAAAKLSDKGKTVVAVVTPDDKPGVVAVVEKSYDAMTADERAKDDAAAMAALDQLAKDLAAITGEEEPTADKKAKAPKPTPAKDPLTDPKPPVVEEKKRDAMTEEERAADDAEAMAALDRLKAELAAE